MPSDKLSAKNNRGRLFTIVRCAVLYSRTYGSRTRGQGQGLEVQVQGLESQGQGLKAQGQGLEVQVQGLEAQGQGLVNWFSGTKTRTFLEDNNTGLQ